MATSPSPGIPFAQHPTLGHGGGADNSPGVEVPVSILVSASLSATATVVLPGWDGCEYDVLGISIVSTTADAQDDTDYWTLDLQDAGSDGTGTTSLFSTAPASTTSGALDFSTANVPSEHQCDADARLGLQYGLKLVMTKAASATTLANVYANIRIRVNVTGN